MDIYCEITNDELEKMARNKNNNNNNNKNKKYECGEYDTQGKYVNKSESLDISSETQKINTDISSEKTKYTDISSIETNSPDIHIETYKPNKKIQYKVPNSINETNITEVKEILIICLISFLIIMLIDFVINL
jgi:hypothetical protein